MKRLAVIAGLVMMLGMALADVTRSQAPPSRTLAYAVVHVGPHPDTHSYLDIVNLDAVSRCYTVRVIYEFVPSTSTIYCVAPLTVKDVYVNNLIIPAEIGAYHASIAVEGPGRFTSAIAVWQGNEKVRMLFPDAVPAQ